MNQEWKFIEGTNQGFEISNSGMIRSTYSDIPGETQNRERGLHTEFKEAYGYYYVKLHGGSLTTTKRIHILVAHHFLDNPRNYKFVKHIDGNRHNNRVDNLEWIKIKAAPKQLIDV